MSKEQSTIVVYELTGSTRRFIVPFEYLSRQFVVVTLLGAGRTVLTVGSDYRFISLNEIETTEAYGGLDGSFLIEIRRVTSATDRLVEFADGSVLRSRDMNVSAIQTIHIAEEARNLAADTLASDDEGNLDARGRRLVNLGDAVSPKDAVTLYQVMEWSQLAGSQANRSQAEADKSAASAAAALVSQNAAAASQSAAKSSETAAKSSETVAKSSETAAKSSETAAKSSETAAKSSETIASQQAQSATTKAGESALSASNALSSEGLAREWAENPVDVPVADEEFSAKHWAQQAKGFAGGDNYLQVQYNLSDIPDKTLARSNLGLGTAAQLDASSDNYGGHAGELVKVGFGGLGARGVSIGTFDWANPAGFNGFQYESMSSATGRPPRASSAYAINLVAYGEEYAHQIGAGINQDTVFFRNKNIGRWREWREFYHTGNSTKNPDGTLKASSPVINLYTDHHDLHNETQFGATPTVTRKSKGVYEITGTLGLRSEGWYLDTPNDRNGNKYFNVEWTQAITPTADGGIVDEYRGDIVVTIETFERVWNKETGMFDNGAPIDINELQDRFVQLRFNEIKVEQEELVDG